MDNNTLTEYMTSRIETVFRDIMSGKKASLKLTAYLAKLAISMAKSEKAAKRNAESGINVPKLLMLSACDKCTLNCDSCISRKLHSSTEQKVLSAAEYDNLLREASSLGIMMNIVAGGEILLRASVLQVFARHDEMLSIVFTNGEKLSEHIETFKKNRNLIPVVSVAADENAAITLMNGANPAPLTLLSREKLIFGAAAVIDKNNWQTLCSEAFLQNIAAAEADILFLIAHPNNSDELLTPDEYDEFARRLDIAQQSVPKLLIISFPLDEARFAGCMAGSEMLYIDAFGRAKGCPYSGGKTVSIRDGGLSYALGASGCSECLKHYSGGAQ